jgi:hypothetical protein
MFKSLFKKKLPLEPIFPVEKYSILRLNVDGGIALATINTAYNNYQNKQFYPWYAAILIEVGEQNENGQPTNEEAGLLNSLEEKITAFLRKTQVVHPIGRVTRKGERDIIYYIDKPNFNEKELKEFFDSINIIRPLNLTIENDRAWTNIAAFIK